MYVYCLYTRAHLICTIPLQMLMLKYMYQMTSSSQFYVVSYYHYFSKISLQGRIAKVCVCACVCMCLSRPHSQVHSCSSKRPGLL